MAKEISNSKYFPTFLTVHKKINPPPPLHMQHGKDKTWNCLPIIKQASHSDQHDC